MQSLILNKRLQTPQSPAAPSFVFCTRGSRVSDRRGNRFAVQQDSFRLQWIPTEQETAANLP